MLSVLLTQKHVPPSFSGFPSTIPTSKAALAVAQTAGRSRWACGPNDFLGGLNSLHFEVVAAPTVDGSELRKTSWSWQFIPLFKRFYTCQVVVWDFWTINSIDTSINSFPRLLCNLFFSFFYTWHSKKIGMIACHHLKSFTRSVSFVLPTWQTSTPIINPSFLVEAATNFSPAFSPSCQPKGAANIRSRSSAASIKPCRAHLRHRVGRSLSRVPPSFRILLLILRLPKFGNENQSNNEPFHTKPHNQYSFQPNKKQISNLNTHTHVHTSWHTYLAKLYSDISPWWISLKSGAPFHLRYFGVWGRFVTSRWNLIRCIP